MSKKKNTLSDLEEFLKQQPSSLVRPSPVEVAPSAIPNPKVASDTAAVDGDNLLQAVIKLAEDKQAFYDFIIEATSQLPGRTEDDALLINAALYLKAGPSWKEAVRAYWSGSKE